MAGSAAASRDNILHSTGGVSDHTGEVREIGNVRRESFVHAVGAARLSLVGAAGLYIL